MNNDGSNSKKDAAIGTLDFSQIPSSSSTSSLSTTNLGSTESEENQRKAKKGKPTTVDAETITTKSLESSRTSTSSSSSSSSSGSIPESATELPHRVPRTTGTSKSREKATAEKQPLTPTPAEADKSQAESTEEKKLAHSKIKFQTIPEETADGVKDESADEGEHKTIRHVRYSGDKLKASKSHHVKRMSLMDDDDDLDDDTDLSSEDSTNLRIGHVFVYMIMPPDGGYGWFIMLISFLCQVVVDGIMFAIGIILPHIAADFNIPPSQVVLVASMQIGFYFLSGAASSAFINKYGFRPVALIGSVLAITVLSIATFSTNLPMMIFFYSFLGGPSLSMIWVSSQLIIGYYFDKFRPIANGISCSGAGAGIMIFSYMNSVLVPELGWRNLMRVHVGFLLIVLLMTFTFIEVAPTRIGRVVEFLDESDSESSGSSAELTKYTRFSLDVDNEEYPLHEDFAPVYERRSTTIKKEPNRCTKCLDQCCPAYQRWLQKRLEKQAEEEAIRKYVIKQDLIERDDLFYMGPKDHDKESEYVDQILKQRTASLVSETEDQAARRTITLEAFKSVHQKKSVINALSTMHMRRDEEDTFKKVQKSYAQLKETEKYPLCAFLSPKNLVHPKIRRAFSLLFDFRLLAIMEFRILLLSAFLFPMGFNIPFVYSTVRVQIDQSFAKLITPTIGFSNFAFRIASGFIAFQYREYTTYICGGGMLFGGLAVLISAFYGLNVVWFQFVYAMCYGMAPAFYSTLRAIIYVRALGLDKLTNAFGLTALAMGLGVFIGTTAGGVLNDLTGSYTASFIFAGICICASGGLKLLLPFLLKRPK